MRGRSVSDKPAMSKALETSSATGRTLNVLLAIAYHARPDGTGAYPSHTRIAEMVGIHSSHDDRAKGAESVRRAVRREVKELGKLGELDVQVGEGPHGVNLYTLPLLAPDKYVPLEVPETKPEAASHKPAPKAHERSGRALHLGAGKCRRCPAEIDSYRQNNQVGMCDQCYAAWEDGVTQGGTSVSGVPGHDGPPPPDAHDLSARTPASPEHVVNINQNSASPLAAESGGSAGTYVEAAPRDRCGHNGCSAVVSQDQDGDLRCLNGHVLEVAA